MSRSGYSRNAQLTIGPVNGSGVTPSPSAVSHGGAGPRSRTSSLTPVRHRRVSPSRSKRLERISWLRPTIRTASARRPASTMPRDLRTGRTVNVHDGRHLTPAGRGDVAGADHVALEMRVRGPVAVSVPGDPDGAERAPQFPSLREVHAVTHAGVGGGGDDGPVAQGAGSHLRPSRHYGADVSRRQSACHVSGRESGGGQPFPGERVVDLRRPDAATEVGTHGPAGEPRGHDAPRRTAQTEDEPTSDASISAAPGQPSATVTSLHDWRLTHLPPDTRPLPSVTAYDQLLRRRRTSGSDHREGEAQ